MRLQLRLTLWLLLVMAVIVTTVSALDLIDEINHEFDSAFTRSTSAKNLATTAVRRAIPPKPPVSLQASVKEDPRLSGELLELLTESQLLVEIAVCDPNNKILNDSDPDRVGQTFIGLERLESLVKSHWWTKLNVLSKGQRSYELVEAISKSKGKPELNVRVVIDPALIRSEIMPSLTHHTWISFATLGWSLIGALIFSTIAFRPLGKLGQMLDLLTRGEYELQQVAPKERPGDEFGVVASKVNLLGQALKGAHIEFSDLKGNVERLLDELEDAVFIFGRDRRLIAAAGAVDRFMARSRTEIIGQPLTEVFPPGTTLGLLLAQAAQFARPIRNRRVPLHSVNGSNQGGTLYIALLTVEFLEASGGGMLIRLRDPEATRMIGRQLQIADRLSAISRLTGGVAHEVKNPLNAILMHVELAKMKLSHGDYDLGPQMEVISSEILRLDRVVKTFLDFTRPVQLTLVEVELQDFLNELVDLAHLQAVSAGVELILEHSEEPVGVTIDSDLLKQALINIVVNAIEAMPNGGTLRIQSRVRGDQAEIRITDSGSGIPPEARDKIYNLYFTTKEHGSGIGLAMTFRIVQLHDGTIDFASEPGKGTTFTIRLPLAVVAA